MKTLIEETISFTKDGIRVAKRVYCEYSHRFKRNVFSTRYEATYEGCYPYSSDRKRTAVEALRFQIYYSGGIKKP